MSPRPDPIPYIPYPENKEEGIYIVPVYPVVQRVLTVLGSGPRRALMAGEPAGPFTEYEVNHMRRALLVYAEAGAVMAYRIRAQSPGLARGAVNGRITGNENGSKMTKIDLEEYRCHDSTPPQRESSSEA